MFQTYPNADYASVCYYGPKNNDKLVDKCDVFLNNENNQINVKTEDYMNHNYFCEINLPMKYGKLCFLCFIKLFCFKIKLKIFSQV